MMRAIPQSASSATRFRGNRTFQFPLYWAISAFQLAAKMGFRTVAIGGGGDKDDLARKLGAEHYIDTGAEDPVAALQALGGARTILATVPSGKAVSPLIGSLGVRGKLVVVGALNQSKPELCHGRPERQHRWPCVWHLGRERGHAALLYNVRRAAGDRDVALGKHPRPTPNYAGRGRGFGWF
jgi:hypothetical protein